MTQKIIEVLVSPKGETTIQTKGFAGADCQHASQSLEEALGVRANEQKTAEFFQSAPLQQNEVRA